LIFLKRDLIFEYLFLKRAALFKARKDLSFDLRYFFKGRVVLSLGIFFKEKVR